ncbi:MAG TPA: D-glycerate dehydrogenase [Nitrososphaeraceae archaeon]
MRKTSLRAHLGKIIALKRWNVYITRKILNPAIAKISKHCNVSVNSKIKPPTKNEIVNEVRNTDAILCTLSDKIDADVIDAAGPSLRVISSYSTGVDHIDVEYATKKGINVTTTGDILTETVADLAFALIIGVSRLIAQGHELVIHNRWKYGWDPNLLLGSDVHNKTLGIVGLGKIGSAVARRAKGFNMDILYRKVHGRNIPIENQLGAKPVSMDEIIQNSDFLSLHSSLNSESYHMIDKPIFRSMKNTAFLINTARGSLIREQDLIEALRKKWIAGAGLDVFEKEPPSPANPLLKMKNVLLLPHIGSASLLTRTKMAEVAAKNLLNVLNGKSPIYSANHPISKLIHE